MAQQAVNSEAVVKDYNPATGTRTTRPLFGEAFVAVRVDDLPEGEAERLAAEGKWYPLTVNEDGELRVATSDQSKMQVRSLEVWLRIEELLKEQVELLRRIA